MPRVLASGLGRRVRLGFSRRPSNQLHPLDVIATRLTVRRLPAVAPCFALGTDGEDEDNVRFGNVAIQGHIAARTTTDDQLTELARRGSPDQRTVRQDLDGGDDLLNASSRISNLVRLQVLKDSLEVFADIDGELDPCHGQRESLRALGFFALFPVARACM